MLKLKLAKRIRRAKAFARSLISPSEIEIHGIVAPTDAACVSPAIRRQLYEGSYEAEEAAACRNHLRSGDRVLELRDVPGDKSPPLLRRKPN